MVVKCLKLNLDVGSLHDFVYFSVLFPADELSMFVRKLNLETNLMVECLRDNVSMLDIEINEKYPP